MKKYSLFLIVIFLISIGSSFQQVTAQEKTKEEQEKEAKIQQSIDQQKKAMAEQKKAQKDAVKILKEKQVELDEALKDIQVETEAAGQDGEALRIFNKRCSRSFAFDEPFVFSAPGCRIFTDIQWVVILKEQHGIFQSR